MSVAPERWAALVAADEGAAVDGGARPGAVIAWRCELAKLIGQARVRAIAAACLTVPFLAAVAFRVQGATPQDTLFGEWVHSSGAALPLVVLGFTGQWVLPLLAAVVAGDIFSSEDHLRTWKTVLTRSRSRADLFVGKFAAAVTYTLAMLVLLAVASTAAGLVMGTQPLVGLSGQLIPAGRADVLVLASWATQAPPLLGFCALAALLSVASRNSVVGVGVPVLLGLVMQLSSLVDMPEVLRAALLVTPFGSWHGFWVRPAFATPLRQGLVTSAAWFVACTDAAWVLFRTRDVRAS